MTTAGRCSERLVSLHRKDAVVEHMDSVHRKDAVVSRMAELFGNVEEIKLPSAGIAAAADNKEPTSSSDPATDVVEGSSGEASSSCVSYESTADRQLEQGEILLPDDPEQVRILLEHNINMSQVITDDVVRKVNDLICRLSADKCQCCGENVQSAHTEGTFVCDVDGCAKKFFLKSSRERHKRVVHLVGDVQQCPQCSARCADRGTLARHMYTHTGLRPYSCQVCNKHFSRKYHLERHKSITLCGGKPAVTYSCQVCLKVFTRKDNLRNHLKAHAGEIRPRKSYTCSYCQKTLSSASMLQIHLRSHTGERPYQCESCHKCFASSAAYTKHTRVHTGQKPYSCPHCDLQFSAKETLNRHVKTHTGVKPHCCQFCGKTFIQASQLKSHIFHHTGRGGFNCPMCDKSFNRKIRLRAHVDFVHEGKKSFTCSQCGKHFVRKEDLARHEILHNEVKQHRCPICDKSFAIKGALKAHLLTHTKEPPRSCEECGRAFIRQDCLIRHMRKKHRQMLEDVMAEAERKKIQQQLMESTRCMQSDYMPLTERFSAEEGELATNGRLADSTLATSLSELLTLLVDETTLQALGHPDEPVQQVLESVIRRCGHVPVQHEAFSHVDKLRENAKLLFTVVIDDNAVKTLLSSQTVDQVILHVLRLARV